MNKIYKVIWSKVRNCYVAVSEIAKRNGKSCTSVNCGGKANRNRGLRMAAVTLGVTAALVGGMGFGTPAAWADGTITVRDASAPDVYDDAHTTGGTLNNISSALYYPSDPSINQLIITGGASNNKGFVACETSGAGEPVTGYTVDVRGTGTSINFAFGIRITSDTSGRTATGNSSNITDGASVSGNVYGAYGIGVVSGNAVTIDNAYAYRVYGGYSEEETAKGNIVNISGIKEGKDYTVFDNVYGGYVSGGTGAATGNKVDISQTDTEVLTKINGKVYGGYSQSGTAGGTGENDGNKVTISGGTVGNEVYGGYVYGSGSAINNSVDISGDSIVSDVYGSFIKSDGNGEAVGNKVVITGENTTIKGRVYGAAVNYSQDVKNNSVKFEANKGSTAYDVYVYGGVALYSSVGAVEENRVEITGGTASYVYGGANGNTSGKAGDVKGNSVTMSGGTVRKNVYGGSSTGTSNVINNTVSLSGGTVSTNVYGGSSENGSASNNVVTIAPIGDTTIKVIGKVYGGYSRSDNESAVVGGKNSDGQEIGNKVRISGINTEVGNEVYGGYAYKCEASYNEVTVTDGATVKSTVLGGYSYLGSAHDNILNIDSATIVNGANVYGGNGAASVYGNRVTISQNGETETNISGNVYGGYSESNAASEALSGEGNVVTITGGTVSGNVYGGYNGSASNNVVNIKGSASLNRIYGSNSSSVSGNELHIGGVKGSSTSSRDNIWTNGTDNTVNSISNFASIVLHDVAWSTTIPVIGATGTISNVGALDITNMTIHGSNNAGDAMNLLKAGNDISSIKLKYNDSEAVSLVNNPITIGGGAYTDKVIVTDLLKFSGTSADTVSLATDNKAIVYTAGANSVSSATFSGTADWSTSAALYSNTSYTFDTNATADLAGLQFNKTAAVTEDPMGQTMTLISGNVQGTVSAQPTDASIAVSLAKSNTTLGGTATGAAAIDAEAGNLTYTINKVALDSVAVTAAGDTPDVLPTGWTKGSTVTVDTGTTALDLTAGTDILTSEIGGLFTGATLSGVNDYNDATNNKHAFASDTAKGVTLDGTQQKGIKASDDGKSLVYAVNDTKDVATITLGTVKTDDPRDMSGTDFDFANTTKVDASALELDVVEPLNISSVIPLVTNATGLAVGVDVDYGEGKTSHSQDVPLVHADTGIVLNATVNGTVATIADTVNYTVTGGTLNSIALDNWNGTAVTGTLTDFSGSGVRVNTGNFTEPTLAAGQSIDIITTTTENFFGVVTGDKEYKKGEAFDDMKNGVTLSGDKYGGVKTNDTKTTLTYYAESMNVDQVTFGEMAWGTGRAAASGYDFINVTSVDASGLTFTNPEAATGSTDLLTDAANLAANAAVDYGTGKTEHSQEFDKTLDNQAVVTAMLTGTVDTSTAGKISYTATGTTMSQFDLANWDGTTASDVPTGWALSSGATVETDGMTAPEVEPGNHIDILKSDTDSFFANATINGDNKYKETSFNEKDSGITLAGTQDKGVKADGKNLVYAAGTKDVVTATMTGEISWKDGGTYYENTKYNFTADSEINVSGVKFTADADPLNQSMTLISNAAGTVKDGTPEFTVALKNTTLEATATGTASTDSGDLKYTVNGVTLDKVIVNGAGDDAVPDGWSTADNLTVDTSKMTVPSGTAYGNPQSILTANSAVFTDDSITGDKKYGANPARFTEEDSTGAVEISGKQDAGVKASADGKSLIYEVGKKEVSAVALGEVKWTAGAELLKADGEEYDYTNAAVNNSLTVTYDAPENVAANESMTLLKANKTLADMAEQEKQHEYKINPVSGVQIDAMITGKLAAKGGAVTFTAAENKASQLTFGKVEWTGSSPLIDHSKTLTNVSFDGAAVDTSNIDFYKEMYIEADQKTTLVSAFGGKPGTIKGAKYLVGTAFEGEGSASMENGNLIFHTKTAAGVSEQTHKAVMGVEATMGLLASGIGHMDKVLDGLGIKSNAGKDGASTSASIGGGKDRYETGSHVNINSWNAAVGVGTSKETKKGTLQYGIFGEYGKGNYTLHSDVGRSDGDAHYAGGGLLAKWTNKHDVYTEASFRLGRVSDTANDLLRDGAGNAYGYDIHATYYGAHVGLGKIFNYKGGKNLDVYGKFFYTKRDGAEFDAKQHYNLDSVNSSVLRIGARYGTNDRKWNWYGGLAYEYEFDGEAKGTVNGTEIRAASIKGSSVRGEFGMRMDATKDNPWQADISLYGYGGKHRGFGGSVTVAYMF